MVFYTQKTGFWALLVGTLLLLRFGSITANDSVHQNDLWKGQATEENIVFSDTVYDRKLKSTGFEKKGQKKDPKKSKKGKKGKTEKKAKKGYEEEEIDFDQLILEVLESDPYFGQDMDEGFFDAESNNEYFNIDWGNETQVDDAVDQVDTAIGGINELIDLFQNGFDPSNPEQLLKAIQQGLVIGSAFVPALAIVAGGLSVLANLFGARPEAAASITDEINKVLNRIDAMESTLREIQSELRDIQELQVWLTIKSELSQATNLWDTAIFQMKSAIQLKDQALITYARNDIQNLCNQASNNERPISMMNIIRKFASSSRNVFGYQQEWPKILNSIDGRVKYFEKEFNTVVNDWTSNIFFMESFCREGSGGENRLKLMKEMEKEILNGMKAKKAEVESKGWINSVTGRCDREFSNPKGACEELAKHYEHDTRYACFRVNRVGSECLSKLPYDMDERAKIENWDLSRPMTGNYGAWPRWPTSHETIGSKTEDGTAITGNLRLICDSKKTDDVLWILYDKRENDNTPDMEQIDPWDTFSGVPLLGNTNIDFANQGCRNGESRNLCADPNASCKPDKPNIQQRCESTKEHVLKNIPQRDPGLYQTLKDRAAVITTKSRSNNASGGGHQTCTRTSDIYGHGVSLYYNAYYYYKHWFYTDRDYSYAFHMIMLSDVVCGNHNAVSCRRCPWNGDEWVGPAWCNGDCKWVAENSPDNEYGGKCTPKTYEN